MQCRCFPLCDSIVFMNFPQLLVSLPLTTLSPLPLLSLLQPVLSNPLYLLKDKVWPLIKSGKVGQFVAPGYHWL